MCVFFLCVPTGQCEMDDISASFIAIDLQSQALATG